MLWGNELPPIGDRGGGAPLWLGGCGGALVPAISNGFPKIRTGTNLSNFGSISWICEAAIFDVDMHYNVVTL